MSGRSLHCQSIHDLRGPDVDLSAAPLIVEIEDGVERLVIGQKSGVAYGLDIETGDILWNQRLGHGGTVAGPTRQTALVLLAEQQHLITGQR